jgi:intraflagellar transport protein 172
LIKLENLKEAEKLYLTVEMVDEAIHMYKQYRQYDQMVRLVATYHKELLNDTNLHIAKSLESEGRLKEAEHYYCESHEWKSAVSMYCANNLFEEAYRV